MAAWSCSCCAWLCLLLGALSAQAERPGFQPLSDLSSYEIVVPRRITRERRDLPKTSQDTFSYVIAIEGKDHTLVLERNR
nr:disintegrin and metalloproteinase domain-containing protein 9-like [Anolis sagrei ordinatus]